MATAPAYSTLIPADLGHTITWGKAIDNRKCIGCHACTIACKMEHEVPLGVNRTYVKQVDVGRYPHVQRHFQVTRCNQCDHAPCVEICPVSAMFQRKDGIVDFDREVCIGCKACMAACPYDAIYIDPQSRSAEKCNFCAHRIDQGLEPACVIVCPERAIVVGDLQDPTSELSRLLAREKTEVRKPEKGTHPKVHYVAGSEYTLVPGAALIPPVHSSSQQKERFPAPPEPNLFRQLMAQGGYASAGTRNAAAAGSAAGAIVAYDVPHGAPWDWRVSAYTWTKSVSAGAYLLKTLILVLGLPAGALWNQAATLLALLFLGLTGLLLVADLKHPERFLNVLLRPQWKSWLARGAYTITGYGAVLGADLALQLFAGGAGTGALAILGVPLALLTAIYTAFLFAQARGRDLWQNPLLPLHLTVQAAMAGAGALLLITARAQGSDRVQSILVISLMAGLLLHLILVASEAVIPHPTRDGDRAARQLVRGAYRGFYWGSVLAALAALAALPGGAAGAGALLALAGLLAYEHAYVQAGQSIPLS